jgi:hypothetical protein
MGAARLLPSVLAAGLYCLAAWSAAAQLILGGWSAGGSAPPPSAYIQKGVNNGMSSYYGVVGSAGGIPDTSVGVISFWQRCLPGNGAQFSGTCNVTGVFGNIGSYGTESVPGVEIVIDNANTYKTMRLNLNDSSGSLTANHTCNLILNNTVPSAQWTHWLFAFDLSASTPRAVMYRNGVLVVTGCNSTNTAVPLVINTGMSGGMALFPHNYTGTGKLISGSPGVTELADFFADFTNAACIMTGSSPGTGNTCTGTSANSIPPATIAKFRAASAPVDLGTNCAGPLGVQPQLCFRGNAAAYNAAGYNEGAATLTGWAMNRATYSASPGGNGSAFYDAPFGAGTDTPALDNAPTHRVKHNWSIGPFSASGTTSISSVAADQPVVLGDFLLLNLIVRDLGTGAAHSLACPSGWTTIYNHDDALSANRKQVMSCYRIADATDVTAAGASTISWTTAQTGGASFILSDYLGVDPLNPVDDSAGQANTTASTSYPAPSVSPANAGDTLVNVFFSSNANVSNYMTPPTGLSQRYYFNPGPSVLVGDRVLTASGATGTASATSSASFTSQTVSIALRPN